MPKFNKPAFGSDGRRRPKVLLKFDYAPFAHTVALHRAFPHHRERVAVTGARGGKTTAGIADVRHRAISQPGFDPEDIDRGEHYSIFIGAPDFPTIKRVILPQFMRSIPIGIIAKPYNHTDHLLQLHGVKGISDVYFLSGRFPESWQGVKAYGVWLDEFARLKEQMYDEARTRLADRRGWLLMTGTPHGPNWAYERLYKPWKAGKRPDLFFSTWKTLENERLPAGMAEEIERHRLTMPRKYFLRTYCASWDVFEGQVYDSWNDSVHVIPAADYTFMIGPRAVGKGKNIVRLAVTVAGVDWGSTKDHKGAIVVLGKSIQGTWYVLEESVAPYGDQQEPVLVRGRNLLEDSWTKRALDLRAKWRIKNFYCDPARPENIRMLREAKLPVEAALNAVDARIQAVSTFMHVDEEMLARGEASTRFQVLDACVATIDEIRNYHWEEGKKNEQPEKVMDDTMDAMGYGLYTAEKRGADNRAPVFEFA